MICSRRNRSRHPAHAPTDDKERIQHQRDIEEKLTSGTIFNQPPPIPPKKEVHESLLKSKTILENQASARNLFPCFDKDSSREFTSPSRSGKLEISTNLVNRDVCEIETAQINLSDNFNTSQNLLPPLQNLNLSSSPSLSNPFNLADPTPQLHAGGLFAQNSALEKTFNLKLPKQRNNDYSIAKGNPQYHNFPNLLQNFGPSEVQIGTNGYLDSQLLNCDLHKFPCLPPVSNGTS